MNRCIFCVGFILLYTLFCYVGFILSVHPVYIYITVSRSRFLEMLPQEWTVVCIGCIFGYALPLIFAGDLFPLFSVPVCFILTSSIYRNQPDFPWIEPRVCTAKVVYCNTMFQFPGHYLFYLRLSIRVIVCIYSLRSLYVSVCVVLC